MQNLETFIFKIKLKIQISFILIFSIKGKKFQVIIQILLK